MNVLVCFASRHGATEEIARAVADHLESAGLQVRVAPAGEVGSFDPFDAVVLGSAVYMGAWQQVARGLLEGEAEVLRKKPVWLFSTGPVGAPLVPEGDPPEVEALMERVGAKGHRTFPGKLDRRGLNLIERLTVSVVRAEDGDFRDWDAVEAWAGEIAAELQGVPQGR